MWEGTIALRLCPCLGLPLLMCSMLLRVQQRAVLLKHQHELNMTSQGSSNLGTVDLQWHRAAMCEAISWESIRYLAVYHRQHSCMCPNEAFPANPSSLESVETTHQLSDLNIDHTCRCGMKEVPTIKNCLQ